MNINHANGTAFNLWQAEPDHADHAFEIYEPGLPLVLIPLGADQPLNADRCLRLGVARTLDAAKATSDDIRTTVSSVLDDPSYRRNAERLRDEIAALPPLTSAVDQLERLAREGRPLFSES